LALIRVDDIGTEGVVRFLRTDEGPKLSDGRILHALAEQGWTTMRSETLMAMCTAQVDWMARVRRGEAATSPVVMKSDGHR
jgi:hypothetical protein